MRYEYCRGLQAVSLMHREPELSAFTQLALSRLSGHNHIPPSLFPHITLIPEQSPADGLSPLVSPIRQYPTVDEA